MNNNIIYLFTSILLDYLLVVYYTSFSCINIHTINKVIYCKWNPYIIHLTLSCSYSYCNHMKIDDSLIRQFFPFFRGCSRLSGIVLVSQVSVKFVLCKCYGPTLLKGT